MFNWRYWPLLDEPKWKALLLSVAVLSTGTVVAVSFGEIMWGIISTLLLLASVAPYFYPTDYTVDATGVKINTPLSKKARPWTYYARAAADDKGVLLSPNYRTSLTDSFRSDYLRCKRDTVKTEEILEYAKRQIATDN